MRLEHDRNRNLPEIRECKQCGRSLNNNYKKDLCPSCIEINLFAEVKEYIRSNDVREMDVANHFHIPISKVRSWIQQGRIEYKATNGKTVSGTKCQICGKKISFGTVCPECHKIQNLQVISKQAGIQPEEMRFLGGRKNNKPKV